MKDPLFLIVILLLLLQFFHIKKLIKHYITSKETVSYEIVY